MLRTLQRSFPTSYTIAVKPERGGPPARQEPGAHPPRSLRGRRGARPRLVRATAQRRRTRPPPTDAARRPRPGSRPGPAEAHRARTTDRGRPGAPPRHSELGESAVPAAGHRESPQRRAGGAARGAYPRVEPTCAPPAGLPLRAALRLPGRHHRGCPVRPLPPTSHPGGGATVAACRGTGSGAVRPIGAEGQRSRARLHRRPAEFSMPEEQSQTIMAVDELQAIIQRCQVLEEADFKGEDFNLFQVAGQKCLEDGYASQLLEVIQNEKNKVIIKNMGWNLISPLVRCIFMYKQEDDKREHCLKILDQLAQLCNPKELFLGLLEQIEQTSGEQVCQTVMLLLQPLQTVLLKLQNKKAYSVGLSLAMIMNQLTPLPVPYTKQQIQEDKLGLCQCCNAVVDFAKPFVSEVVKNMEKSSEYNDMELKEELLKFCMKSLKYPLLTAQLEQLEGIEEHPFRRFATEIIDILWNIRELIPLVFLHRKGKSPHWENQEFADIEQKNSAESLACLSYLMFVQRFGIDCFPMVFSPSYLLQCNMTHIEVLLIRTEESMLSKGLDLFESCLLRMENNSLLHQYLEFKGFINVPQVLVKVMTLCPIEHLRKKSLNILQLFIDKFDAEGKYTLFRCLLKTSNHAGVEGYVIKNIKDQIHLSLMKACDNTWFTGQHLISLLDLVLLLPEGAETDLLQNSDRIMASLNLLRYLIIKDCESDNQTGVWTILPKIEQNFLKPLHVGLNMSKAHYEAEIKNKKENRREAHSSNTVCSLTVSGEKMPAMTTEMQLQVLHSALFTFDLIESVLSRVEELIEVKIKGGMDENS